eukprot:TRINITY_DN8446_c0_g1_i1.p1 TRINITY_DN8446_c0_g1~~TRINITY_DN8446_c0_g1_i1.p1  ORF type:complete len:250 (+),score=71.90 TRINITY_DN8446_c0_g1_i1:51-752(+)
MLGRVDTIFTYYFYQRPADFVSTNVASRSFWWGSSSLSKATTTPTFIDYLHVTSLKSHSPSSSASSSLKEEKRGVKREREEENSSADSEVDKASPESNKLAKLLMEEQENPIQSEIEALKKQNYDIESHFDETDDHNDSDDDANEAISNIKIKPTSNNPLIFTLHLDTLPPVKFVVPADYPKSSVTYEFPFQYEHSKYLQQTRGQIENKIKNLPQPYKLTSLVHTIASQFSRI